MMSGSSYDNQWMKRARWLTQALILSGALNIGLLATFVHFILKDKKQSVAFELKPLFQTDKLKAKPAVTNGSLLSAYSTLSFAELLNLLENKDLVEEGYLKRDLALSCLNAFHYFNLERALGGIVLQRRQTFFKNPDGDETIELTIFPGLADYQYQAILYYARTEKWPLTCQGLFYELKEQKSPRDASLMEAFFLTPEFHAVSTLFSKSGLNIPKNILVDMLAQGDWNTIEEFTVQQRKIQDLSVDKRRQLLLNYLDRSSPIAAKILLEADTDFVAKRLDDFQIIRVLELLDEKSSTLENLAKELVCSTRSDEVLKMAGAKLYCFAGEAVPDPYDHNLACRRFLPEKAIELEMKQVADNQSAALAPKKIEEARSSSPDKEKNQRMYVVQSGDSLWKIARRYKVSIESIMKINHLESEKLRPGKQLEIPDN